VGKAAKVTASAAGEGAPPAKAAKVAAKAKAEKSRQKREKLRAELVRELSQLREHLAVTAQAVQGRMDAEIAGILSAFDGAGIPGEPERLPPARIQAMMVMALKDLKIKPEKGRLKDLGRIAEAAALLAKFMPQGG
jgi:hypothetical protein